MRRCDVILVRTTARTLRLECVEVKSRRAAALPAALVDDIVDQLDATVQMLHDTFFRTDPPRIDAELQRARLGGILRHHADRALAMGLLDDRRRAEVERMIEKVEDGALVPEIGRRGYVVSLGGAAGFPAEHRGVRIDVLTAADLGAVGLGSRREGRPSDDGARRPGPAPLPSGRHAKPATGTPPRPRPDVEPPTRPLPRPQPAPPGSAAVPPVNGQDLPTAGADDATRPLRPSPTPRVPERPTPIPVPQPPTRPATVDVRLGQDEHAADVRWRISTQGSPHLFVLGIPGQGKSVTTRRILDSFAEQGLPALVVDFHGDMAAAPAGGAAVLDASQGLPISPFELDEPARYREAAWELSEVIGYVCRLGEIQRNVVYDGVRGIYEQHGFGSPSRPDRRAHHGRARAGRHRGRGHRPRPQRRRPAAPAQRLRPVHRPRRGRRLRRPAAPRRRPRRARPDGAGAARGRRVRAAQGLPRDVPVGTDHSSCGWPSCSTRPTASPATSPSPRS